MGHIFNMEFYLLYLYLIINFKKGLLFSKI